VDGDNVRVLEAGDGFGLAVKALHPGLVPHQQRVEHLERHLAVEGNVQGAVDGGKAALAQFFDDALLA